MKKKYFKKKASTTDGKRMFIEIPQKYIKEFRVTKNTEFIVRKIEGKNGKKKVTSKGIN